MLNLDINERSFAEAVESQLGRRHTPATQQGHHVDSVAAYDRSNLIAGDVYNYGVLFGQSQESDEIKSFGLCLAAAPLIDTSDFVGRVDELNQMKDFLRPGEMVTEQRRLVLGGMGGIGKTQLAIAYARLHPASYKSIFWVNATTELTLKESFRTIIRQLLQLAGLEKLGNEQVVPRVLNWFADTRNTQWLLIFDNYDEPDQFAIDDYVPHAAHGSIVITTRLPDHVKGSCVRVQPFRDLEESLVTLQSRSGRGNVKNGE